MLNVGRQRIAAGAHGVAAGEASDSAVGDSPCVAAPRAWWRRNPFARIRVMPRLAQSRPLPVRNLVTLLGGIIALVTALSIPIGYGIIGHFKEAQSLTYKAELTAARAAQYIYAPDAPWKYDTDQLAAISEILTPTAIPIVQRIIDKQGAMMMQKGKALPWPTFARDAPIFASGAMVGTAEVSASLRPLLAEVGLVALGALVLAVAAYFAFAVLPLGVIDRTLGELRAANDKLEKQNLLLDTALENMAQGLAMYDAEARIVIANDRYARLYGLDPQQVKPGTTLREIVEHRMAKGLYAGENVDDLVKTMLERASKPTIDHVINGLSDGRVIAATIQPRADGGWVVTHQDITERESLSAQLARQNELLREREEELKAQNERFDTALRNMSHGLCMFDAEQRVVMANERYAEIYGLTPEQVKPGTTLRQIIVHRIARGLFAGANPEEYIKERLAKFNDASTAVHRLSDGRAICVRRQPMREGGWVTTHEDITERQKLQLRLEQQNQQLDAAMNNMSQGLAMFDDEQRLVICNRHYAEMYRLTPDQIRPGATAREIVQHRFANGCYPAADPQRRVDAFVARTWNMTSEVHELADGRIINVSYRKTANGGHVFTHQDITERQRLNAQLEQQHLLLKQQEEKLRLKNVQLDAALNNMVQGLAMFDAELRVVIANNRYAEIYGLSAEQVAPGTTLRQILECRIANGCCPGKAADEMLDSMLGRTAGKTYSHYTTRLIDSRCIAVSLQKMADGGTVTTHQDITEQRRSEAKIVHMALHDALTDLPNRVLLNERLEHALTRVKRGEIVAVHLLDLDHFKTVNDTLGHPTGDRLLKMVTERLHELVRETDTIARMGGDEFAVLQVAIFQPADATALALRIIEAVSAPYTIDGQQVIIGTSVGIAVGPSDVLSPDQLIRNADLALYRAKADGRGTYRFFGPEMDAQMQVRRIMEYDLRKALPAGEFELYYQPVVNLANDEISGVEALIRWRHPERGLIPPSAFIPVAEEIGFIIPLGEWALRQACQTARNWPSDIRIAVNLSPIQFRNPGFVQLVVSALAASDLAPDRLELEITETILLQDSEATLSTLYQLRALGVRIAMDDFGTGYSSLSYLQSFPFDKIKIDRSFVKDIADGVGSLNIVRAVAAMANGLGMATTAEGVETKEQLDTVRAEGCTEMQGFLFSRPLPAREIEELLLARRKPSGNKDRPAEYAA
jgi:diguanylate cyclase (GGDEF)-like protein/PAS domain S-box-containing protein